MNQWNTQLTARGARLANRPIKCGIFQGDTLSPIIVCVTLIPLSTTLNKTTLGYTLKRGQKLKHLLHMDDLHTVHTMLYAMTENETKGLVNTVDIFFSKDVGMKIEISIRAKSIPTQRNI